MGPVRHHGERRRLRADQDAAHTEAAAGADATIRIDDRDIKVGIGAGLLEAMESGIPLGRAGTPEDAANAVYLFCIPESDYITGQVVVAGGGLVL